MLPALIHQCKNNSFLSFLRVLHFSFSRSTALSSLSSSLPVFFYVFPISSSFRYARRVRVCFVVYFVHFSLISHLNQYDCRCVWVYLPLTYSCSPTHHQHPHRGRTPIISIYFNNLQKLLQLKRGLFVNLLQQTHFIVQAAWMLFLLLPLGCDHIKNK